VFLGIKTFVLNSYRKRKRANVSVRVREDPARDVAAYLPPEEIEDMNVE